MNTPPPFSSLPPEIHHLILHDLTSPHDLLPLLLILPHLTSSLTPAQTRAPTPTTKRSSTSPPPTTTPPSQPPPSPPPPQTPTPSPQSPPPPRRPHPPTAAPRPQP
ncbi:hypothetical protein VC83_07441 [Pseudogymnoascus destructans]|uniref:Uncharacterized protein n=1 Tax=Pseudogymnoascus destructans TaxID=655981 RepID=A0A177A3G0_9PEZI|nr:uncharacterized protein VC83_07441 [Pseudogymnoascus destructans]OAF56130.1 hypothetical protein VC83_07441 [Pseudogymnoascus destructans]